MHKFHILMLSVGSFLGQNMLDSLEGRRDRVRITGLNSESANPRVFRCDKTYKAPLSHTPEFRSFLLDVIATEQPNLILPGRDNDVLLLAELVRDNPELQARIPVGDVEAVRIMNDKARSYRFAREHGLPFVDTYVIEADGAHGDVIEGARAWAQTVGFPLLAKPDEGFASLGIRTLSNEQQLMTFLADRPHGFSLQQIIGMPGEHRKWLDSYAEDAKKGAPLFFHFPDPNHYAGQTYILPNGTVGDIFTGRSLMVIGRCEQVDVLADPVLIQTTRAYAEALSKIGWRGTLNIQFRQADGQFYAIELNPRMSGSTSQRLWLGYDEMRLMIQAFCHFDIGADARIADKPDGIVFRSLSDFFVATNDMRTLEQTGVYTRERSSLGIVHKNRQTVLLTGATGYCGKALVDYLATDDRYELYVFSRNKAHAKQMLADKVAQVYDEKDFASDAIPWTTIDVLIHFGFARPYLGNQEIASSLAFTADLFTRAVMARVPAIINVSSRSVYGNERPGPWHVDSPPAPVSPYGQAKLAAELILRSLTAASPHTRATSVRMGTVSGGADGIVFDFVLHKFVRQALAGSPLHVIGGMQEYDILDVHDVAEAFAAMLRVSPANWQPIYNLSSAHTYTLIEMAQCAVDVAVRLNGGSHTPIEVEERDIQLKYGMNSDSFYRDMNWQPKRTQLAELVASIVPFV